MAKNIKTKSKLEIAIDTLGKNIKPIFSGFNETNFKLENYRNDFILHAYDYLKVLRTEDNNEDNHSFNAINKKCLYFNDLLVDIIHKQVIDLYRFS